MIARRIGIGPERRAGFRGFGASSMSVRLLDYSLGTYTRTGTGYYPTGAATLTSVAQNVRRFPATYGDRYDMTLFEAIKVINTIYSEEHDNAAWVAVNCSVTPNTHVSPFGDTTADTITVTSSGIAATLTQTTANSTANCYFGVYARSGSTSQTNSITVTNGTTSGNLDFTTTTTWARYSVKKLGGAVSINSVVIRPHAYAGTGTAGNNLVVWGSNHVAGTSMQSYLKTTSAAATVGADTLTYSAGTWDSRLATSKWQFTFAHVSDASDLNVTQTYFSFGGDNDRIGVSSADQIFIQVGGAVRLGPVISWGRDSTFVNIKLNPASGDIIVSGATSGNGTTNVGSWSWPTAATVLRVGGSYLVAGSESNARLTEPYTW